jgi:hypothetical protein
MAINTKGSKTDGNGWRVEQYYNPATDSYEAIEGSGGAANMKLTGRNVELQRNLNVTVTAGSTVTFSDINIENVTEVYAYAVSNSGHSFNLNIQWKHLNGTAGLTSFADTTTTKASSGAAQANTGKIGVKSKNIAMTIANSDTVNRQYDVVAGGIN